MSRQSHEYVVSLIRLLSRLDELINRLDELIKVLSARPAPAAVPVAPAVTPIEIPPNNRYRVFYFDLEKPRTNEPVGLSEQGIVARCASVVRCDSPAYWRRNSPDGDLEELSAGYCVDNFEIRELYITNPAGVGRLAVVVEWRE